MAKKNRKEYNQKPWLTSWACQRRYPSRLYLVILHIDQVIRLLAQCSPQWHPLFERGFPITSQPEPRINSRIKKNSHQALARLSAKNLSACPPRPTHYLCPPILFLCVSGSTCIRDNSSPGVKAAAVDVSQAQGRPVRDRSDSRPSCRQQSKVMHRI